MLSGFEASLGQPDSRLEFVVVDALAPTNEKVVLLVTFTGLALDIPAEKNRCFQNKILNGSKLTEL